jgi:leucyl aminopeptidase
VLARTVPSPAVPTALAEVELVPSTTRRGQSRAGVTGAGDPPWFGPDAEELLAEIAPATAPAGRAGELRTGARRWLVGVGERTVADWRTAGAALVRAVLDSAEPGARRAATADLSLPADVSAEELTGLVLGLRLGGYSFRVSNTEDRPVPPVIRLRLPEPAPGQSAAVRRAGVLAAATALARDLANTPSNVKDPEWLAGVAVRLAEETPGLAATVRDEQWLAEQGFGGIIAVGSSSVAPPRLIELTWKPRGAPAAPHLVLVGKGITFDTGGVSLKPADGMHLMRTDMAGGGAVIAAMRAIAELKLPLRVTGLVPAAENHLSGSAYRPGDIVRHFGGTTTEVTNTDAEGRMVLADAMAYAVRRLRPTMLVDVATLTGAMKVSLGLRTGGLFASDDVVAGQLTAAGERAGEKLWRMPLLADHAEGVYGERGDVRQGPPGPPGITAALFLREFTGGLPWAHLDIAGPARADKQYLDVVPGATGFAARTLVALVESLSESSAR